MEVKPYTISTVAALLTAGFMGIAASTRMLSPVAKNNARVEALNQVINHVKADTCYAIKGEPPNIGTTIHRKGEGQIPTSCLHYSAAGQYAYIGQLNHRLQVLYVFSQVEVSKAKGKDDG